MSVIGAYRGLWLALAGIMIAAFGSAQAQEALPRLDWKFQGAVGRTTAESAPPQWPKGVRRPRSTQHHRDPDR